MKLEFLDTYSIRVRLSTSAILFAPIAITTFLCFEEINTLASSSVFIFVLLAFTNYIPILQRYLYKDKFSRGNYAVQFLLPSDPTIDNVTKMRYYEKLSTIDTSFNKLKTDNEKDEHQSCCISAVYYLRTHTRDNHLIQEENINYGFCKNLIASKAIGIAICLFIIIFISLFSWIKFKSFSSIPSNNYFSLFFSTLMLLFWLFGVKEKMLDDARKRYAKTLLSAIDLL